MPLNDVIYLYGPADGVEAGEFGAGLVRSRSSRPLCELSQPNIFYLVLDERRTRLDPAVIADLLTPISIRRGVPYLVTGRIMLNDIPSACPFILRVLNPRLNILGATS